MSGATVRTSMPRFRESADVSRRSGVTLVRRRALPLRATLWSIACVVILGLCGGCSAVKQTLGKQKQAVVDPYATGNFLSDCTQIGWIWPRGTSSTGPVPYVPREGDLIFASSISPKRTLQYVFLAKIGLPHHVMMVVRKSDGRLGTFEVGSGGDRSVVIRPIYDRLFKHKELYDGSVLAVRQIRRPLSPEESYRLTCFAESQIGKPFSPPKQFIPIAIPGRPVGETCNGQETWFCSELVVQALRVSGLLVGVGKPKAIVPEDLYIDDRNDLSHLWTRPQDWSPTTKPTLRRPVFDPDRGLSP